MLHFAPKRVLLIPDIHSPMKKTFRSVIYVIIAIVIVVGLVAFFQSRTKAKEGNVRTTEVRRMDITQDVSFSGNLAAKQKAELGFEAMGTVTGVYVEAGDTVQKGQKLAQLDTRTASLELAKARASLASGQDQAYLTWQKAERDVLDTAAINKKTLEKYRQSVIDAKVAWDQAKEAYEQTKDESGDYSSITKNKYSTVLTAEAAYHTARQVQREGIETANKANNSAQKAAEIAKAQYAATTDLSSGSAGMSVLEASAALAEVNLAKSALYAPFSGIITKKDISIGSSTTAGKTVLTIESNDGIEVVADVPETDAMKLNVGQAATITFDAFTQSEEWTGAVTSISPAAKTVGGVPTYEVKLSINDSGKLRSGLTANVTVHAAKNNAVLGIPRRTVVTKGDKQYVTVLGDDKQTGEREVKTGLLGSDGNIEIINGLNEGERVVIEANK